MRTWLLLCVCFLALTATSCRKSEDAAVRDKKQLGNPVTEVHFNKNEVTDADLKDLKELKQLTTLSLWGTQVTDKGLEELKELKQLAYLDLSGTEVTREGADDLRMALPGCLIDRMLR